MKFPCIILIKRFDFVWLSQDVFEFVTSIFKNSFEMGHFEIVDCTQILSALNYRFLDEGCGIWFFAKNQILLCATK